uniref:AP complex mu/sigma subunit domain-containing protein n=1 Tax=Timema douglasi TaxID=61478 RepID=A0A7R8ZEQ8_TIMDO|nr:unnamed protein product [Timema douglasi]
MRGWVTTESALEFTVLYTLRCCLALSNKRKGSFSLVRENVHYILNELVMGGMVLETNMTEILTRIEDQNKLEKQEVECFFFLAEDLCCGKVIAECWTRRGPQYTGISRVVRACSRVAEPAADGVGIIEPLGLSVASHAPGPSATLVYDSYFPNDPPEIRGLIPFEGLCRFCHSRALQVQSKLHERCIKNSFHIITRVGLIFIIIIIIIIVA